MKRKLILSVIPLFLISSLVAGCTDEDELVEPATQQSSTIHRFADSDVAEEEAQSAAEAAKREAEAEAQKKAEEEAARASAEAEAARVAAEEEAARVAAEQEAARVAAEAEAVRVAEQQATENVYYKNCSAARAAGAAPVYAGSPGYGTHLDRDGDGIGCE
ncbi:excalibur calcium-binding domain-containing protein [Actinomycetaceae bacterium MB13-C1-2]|nr:excalibur calcium-binding domain-containing protein [Actinomycetaceae bacterium MB13-C1-2]